jgi:methyltransferase (TIGR00027 family)
VAKIPWRRAFSDAASEESFMRRLAAVLLFIAIELVLLPVTLLGAVWHWAKLTLTHRRMGSSSTASEVLLVRWILHTEGARQDDAARSLLLSLPAISPVALWMMTGPTLLAARLSGYRPPRMDYPPARPTMAVQIVPQRTDFFDRALRDHASTTRQLVILGAGWDTRAYNLPDGAGVSVFEVDTAEMVAVKRVALRDAGIEAAHVVFVGVDFNEEPWLDALEQHGFDPGLPTFFLWEGVVYYLEEEAVHATLETIGSLASGSVVAFDYASREMVEGSGSLAFRMGKRSLEAIGEPLRFGISTVPPARKQVADLLAAHGLELERYEAWGEESGDRMPFGGMVAAVS